MNRKLCLDVWLSRRKLIESSTFKTVKFVKAIFSLVTGTKSEEKVKKCYQNDRIAKL